jgi:intracellular septation protein A
MSVEYIPYITMVMGMSAVITQYNSFIEAKDMSNVPYVGLFGMLLIAILTMIYSTSKSLPLIPVYVNIAIALILIVTKAFFKETNVFNSETKNCE